jgi:hypothetical protein
MRSSTIIRHLRRPVVAIVAAGALVITAGVYAYASIPDPGGVIHGCFNKAGVLRVIDTAVTQNCLSTETSLNWSQTGPQGVPGVQGPPGAPGAPGAPGFSHAYAVSHGGNDFGGGPTCNWGVSVFPTTVDSLSLPAGTYLVWADGTAASTDNTQSQYTAMLLTGPGMTREQDLIVNPGQHGLAFSLSGTVTLSSPGSVSLGCVDTTNGDPPTRQMFCSAMSHDVRPCRPWSWCVGCAARPNADLS